MLRNGLTALSLLALAAAPALAAPVTVVDFESVPGVSPTAGYGDGSWVAAGEVLGTQLQSAYGVSFASGQNGVALVGLGAGHATSGVNGIGGVTAGGQLVYSTPVVVTFSVPGSPGTPAVTDFVSIRGDQHPTIFGTATLEAFDLGGNLLGAQTATDTTGLTLALAFPGIHSVRVSQNVSDIAFDDLSFGRPVAAAPDDAPVPEPASAAVLGVALCGLAVRRLRARA